MKRFSRCLLVFSLSLCLGAAAQGLPGRLPGTLPGQQPAGQQPAAAPKPATTLPSAAKTDIPAACCEITAIDKAKGVVTAKERNNGRTVEFKVSDSAVLQKLQVGQAVHANFDGRQVSVDGKKMCCAIMSVAAAPSIASTMP